MNAGKVAYALLFCAALPALLWLWARGTEPGIALPVVHWPYAGAAAAGAGVLVMALGMIALRLHGGGLPMNAFPPPRRAERGVYAWIDHPIYVGFCLAVAGCALWSGSRAGLWLITPISMLGCAALVLGYERDDLLKRLGPRARPPRLRIAADTPDAPDAWDRVSLLVLVFAVWLMAYEWIGHVPTHGAPSTATRLDAMVPIVPWTEVLYAGTYALGVIPPLLLPTRRALRRFEIAGLTGTAVGFWICVAFPNVFPLREFPANSMFAPLHALERMDGVGGNIAFPSFHVFWAILGAWAMRQRGAGWPGAVLALGVSLSCLTTGMHGVVDIAGGALLACAALNVHRVWGAMLAGAQAVADGWHAWRIGPVRLLVHAVYAGLSAGVGMILAEWLAGEAGRPALRVMAAAALLGAGAWGQVFEGSGKLARPFGYYGCVIGALAGAMLTAALGWDTWCAIGALAVATPWIQAIGRLRCLVQGCCHGSVCEPGRGLRYSTALSRVCALADLQGRTIHATPLYSIVANVAIGSVLVRMHLGGATSPMIAGLYLVLSGLARFVEEHFRAEPQTRVLAGLRAYQWLALLGVVAGAAVTCMHSQTRAVPSGFAVALPSIASAGLVAMAYGAAMGVDFPGSSRRFARLAGT